MPSWASPPTSITDHWQDSTLWNECIGAADERLRAIADGSTVLSTPPFGDTPTIRLFDPLNPSLGPSNIQSSRAGNAFGAPAYALNPADDPQWPMFGALTMAQLQYHVFGFAGGASGGPGQFVDPDAPDIDGLSSIPSPVDLMLTQYKVATALGMRIQDHIDPTTAWDDPRNGTHLFTRKRRREVYKAVIALPTNTKDDQWFINWGAATPPAWVRFPMNAATTGQRANWFQTPAGVDPPTSPSGRFKGVQQYDGVFWDPVTDQTVFADMLSSENDPTAGSWCPASIMQPRDIFGPWLWAEYKGSLQLMTRTYRGATAPSGVPTVNQYQGIGRTVTYYGKRTSDGIWETIATDTFAAGADALGNDASATTITPADYSAYAAITDWDFAYT